LKAGAGGDLHIKVTDAARRAFRGLRRIRFLNKLRLAANMMKQVKAHYKNYPEDPGNFERWRLKTDALFKEARSKLTE